IADALTELTVSSPTTVDRRFQALTKLLIKGTAIRRRRRHHRLDFEEQSSIARDRGQAVHALLRPGVPVDAPARSPAVLDQELITTARSRTISDESHHVVDRAAAVAGDTSLAV